MTTKLDPYARSTYHGKLLDLATIQAVQEAERRLGYPLTIVQGIGGAAASAGTHLRGRNIDVAPWDIKRKDKVLKDVGFIGWHRPRLPGVWGEHGHYVLCLETRDNRRGIADSAFRQIGSFDRGRNGLKGDGPDNGYRPPRRVNYQFVQQPKPRVQVTQVQKSRDKLVETLADLEAAWAALSHADETRVVARSFLDDIDQEQDHIRRILAGMPNDHRPVAA